MVQVGTSNRTQSVQVQPFLSSSETLHPTDCASTIGQLGNLLLAIRLYGKHSMKQADLPPCKVTVPASCLTASVTHTDIVECFPSCLSDCVKLC